MRCFNRGLPSVWGGVLFCVLCVFWLPTFANPGGPDTPLGDAERVDTQTDNGDTSIAVFSDAVGNIVTIYARAFGDNQAIYARRFPIDRLAGDPVVINTRPVQSTFRSDAAMNTAGTFVVVWRGRNTQGGATLFAQRYNAALNSVGPVLIIGSGGTPSVDINADGDFVVSWLEFDASGRRLFVRRYDSQGQPSTDRIPVDDTGEAVNSDVAVGPKGEFVVVYDGFPEDASQPSNEIFLQRFDSAGARVDSPIQVNTATEDIQESPAISMGPAGDFVVVWDDEETGSIEGRRFTANGDPIDDQFAVSVDGVNFRADVAYDGTGGFAVTWEGVDRLLARRYDAAGNPADLVTVESGEDADKPRIASDVDGDYMVLWTADIQDSPVFLRRYVGPENVDLSARLVPDATQVGPRAVVGYRLIIDNNHDPVAPVDTGLTGADTLNRAIGAATGVAVTLKLPDGLSDIRVADTTAPENRTLDCAHPEAGAVTCRLDGALFAGESLSARVNARAPAQPQMLRATLSVTANQADPNQAQDTGNNSDSAAITVGDAGDESGASDHNDDSSSGGGCTMAASAGPADPLFWLLISLAVGAIAGKRIRRGRNHTVAGY